MGLDDDISLMEHGIKPGRRLNFRPLYIMEFDILDTPRIDVPIDIYESELGHEPHIVVPVEYLVEYVEVKRTYVQLDIRKRNKAP